MPKILICDDEPGLRAVIRKYAEFEGHEVVEADDGIYAIEACRGENFDVIVMDIMMPVMDGFSAVKKIREFSDVPVIMLSARGEEYDKVLAFELGVDDYVVKPFSSKELMLRIAAILKRTGKGAEQNKHVVFEKDEFLADMTAHKVTISGKQIDLSPKLYDLLFLLIRNKGIALSREKILTEVWGFDYFGDDRTLDTHMKLLRKALGQYGRLVKTLRGLGYRFEEN
ncbi:MAG: response regulator transcription factor [Oscillospiraceae bacterium]|nr:response regulator transcription factor [Oscillospiraceae bacterium]